MFYYCMYLKIDLSFYMFAIIFWIRWMVKVVRKNQQRIQINSRTTQPLLRVSLLWSLSDRNCMLSPCSLGLSATRQHYFSLRTNQPPATSQQYFSFRPAPTISNQPNQQAVCWVLGFCFLSRRHDSHASMQAGMHAPQYSVHTTSSSSSYYLVYFT
jgi:hypothetical protein